MRYKIGDNVLVVPHPTYVDCGWCSDMSKFCNKIVTIEQVNSRTYFVEGSFAYWDDGCFVGKIVANRLVRGD